MAKKGGGFGLIMLVIVMAVVLLLVAKTWKNVAPTVVDLDRANSMVGPLDSHGENDAAEEVRSGDLPRLSQMEQRTEEHAAEVGNALEQID
jgi:hypothetical protein